MVRFGNHGQIQGVDGLVHIVAKLNEREWWTTGCEMRGPWHKEERWRDFEVPDGPTCLICARLSMEYAVDEGI